MSNITTTNPDDVLSQSNADVFFVIYTTAQGNYFGLPGGGLRHVEHGFGNSPAIRRKNLPTQYYSVLNSIKANKLLPDGRLDIVELPNWS